jgi:hypothetical protein
MILKRVYYESRKRQLNTRPMIYVYYESRKREVQTRPIYVLLYECQCDERLKLNLRNLHVSDTVSGNWDT